MSSYHCLTRRLMNVSVILLFSLALLLFPVAQAGAYESFSTEVSLYQGVSLRDGLFAFDPLILTLIVNPSDQVTTVLPEDPRELFHFGSEIEFSVAYDPVAPEHLLLMPEHVAGLAVLEHTRLADLDEATLAGLDMAENPPPIAIHAEDIIVLRIDDGSHVALGDLRRQDDWTINFEYLKTTPQAIPEPSAFMLFGLGAFGFFGRLVIRKLPHTPTKEA